jgi:hypothetical protein
MELQMLNGYLVLLNLVSNVDELLFVHPDELQVLLRNVVIVLLHFFEGFLVVLHKIVDVLVFTLLNLVDFDLHSELKLILKLLELCLIAGD